MKYFMDYYWIFYKNVFPPKETIRMLLKLVAMFAGFVCVYVCVWLDLPFIFFY